MTEAGRCALVRSAVAMLFAAVLSAAPAHAQTPATGGSPPVPQGSPIPRVAPMPPPPTVPPVAPAPLPPPAALPTRAEVVTGVTIEGATVYSDALLKDKTKLLIGPQTSVSDIDAARRAILMMYRGDGYPFVTVSVRKEKGGLLRFLVAEGYIAEIKLSGDVGPVGTLVLRFLNHLTEERPINNASIERWLLLAQSIPGLQIRPVMQPSEREPGALTLVAKLSRTVFSGSSAFDNRAFRNTGAGEGLLTLGVNSLTSLGERTEASFYVAGPTGQQVFGQASEQVFVGGSGLTVRIYGGAGDTLPCCDLRAVGYDGKTVVFGAQASYPVLLSRQQQLFLRADFDALDAGTYENGSRASGDSLRVVRGEADYNLSDAVLGTGYEGDNTVSVRVSHGLRGLGASANGRTDGGRLNENMGFTKVNAEVSRDQTLVALSDGSRISLFGLAAGQATGDVLPTAEAFYMGGLRYTRGFYSGEVVGDNALALTAELRFSSSFTTNGFGSEFTITPQFYLFYDWGETWQNQATDANHMLRTYGFGVRTGITPNVRVEFEALRRMTRQVAGVNVNPEAANAFYWRVVTVF